MPVIDDVRESHGMMKDRSFKEKVAYFWEYYKLHTIAVILGSIFLFALIKNVVTAKDTAFQVIMINALNAPNAQEFAATIDINPKKEEVIFDSGYFFSPDINAIDSSSYANSQKLMAVIASGSADVIVGADEVTNRYYDTGLFGDLRDFFTEDELTAMGDKVIWHAPIDEDTGEALDEIPMLIDITDSTQLVDNGCFYDTKVVFGVVVNTKNGDKVPAFYDFLYSSSSSATE